MGEVLTVVEAAELLRVNRDTLYAAINRGEVPHFRIGRIIRLSRTQILEMVAGQQATVAEE